MSQFDNEAVWPSSLERPNDFRVDCADRHAACWTPALLRVGEKTTGGTYRSVERNREGSHWLAVPVRGAPHGPKDTHLHAKRCHNHNDNYLIAKIYNSLEN